MDVKNSSRNTEVEQKIGFQTLHILQSFTLSCLFINTELTNQLLSIPYRLARRAGVPTYRPNSCLTGRIKCSISGKHITQNNFRSNSASMLILSELIIQLMGIPLIRCPIAHAYWQIYLLICSTCSINCLFLLDWPIEYWACLYCCPIVHAYRQKDLSICQQAQSSAELEAHSGKLLTQVLLQSYGISNSIRKQSQSIVYL